MPYLPQDERTDDKDHCVVTMAKEETLLHPKLFSSIPSDSLASQASQNTGTIATRIMAVSSVIVCIIMVISMTVGPAVTVIADVEDTVALAREYGGYIPHKATIASDFIGSHNLQAGVFGESETDSMPPPRNTTMRRRRELATASARYSQASARYGQVVQRNSSRKSSDEEFVQPDEWSYGDGDSDARRSSFSRATSGGVRTGGARPVLMEFKGYMEPGARVYYQEPLEGDYSDPYYRFSSKYGKKFYGKKRRCYYVKTDLDLDCPGNKLFMKGKYDQLGGVFLHFPGGEEHAKQTLDSWKPKYTKGWKLVTDEKKVKKHAIKISLDGEKIGPGVFYQKRYKKGDLDTNIKLGGNNGGPYQYLVFGCLQKEEKSTG